MLMVWWPVQLCYIHYLAIPREERFLLEHDRDYGALLASVNRYPLLDDGIAELFVPVFAAMLFACGVHENVTWNQLSLRK